MWIEYGRKGNKKDGFKHYQALTEAERKQAMMAIPAYFNTQPEPQYRKDIERYLAKKHWESFLSTSESGEVKVERIKILPNLANNFKFSLWDEIPKGVSQEERWQWYRDNRVTCVVDARSTGGHLCAQSSSRLGGCVSGKGSQARATPFLAEQASVPEVETSV